MKKILAILLAATMLLSLAACGTAAEELILSADHENKTLAVSIPEGLLDL